MTDRFERQVDLDGTLDPRERALRAEQARKAHMTRMALKSAQAAAGGRCRRRLRMLVLISIKDRRSSTT
jgi:hypothetical protein